MTNQENPPEYKDARINVSLTRQAAIDIERLRCALELKLKRRLSIAQVMKQLIELGLKELNS